jgi:hypothetical protein
LIAEVGLTSAERLDPSGSRRLKARGEPMRERCAGRIAGVID